MQHKKLERWEGKLKRVFDQIDDALEDRFGESYPLHPARAKRNATANKSQDGLFNIGAAYSLGIGSKYGPGYVVEIKMSTLVNVPTEIKNEIDLFVFSHLKTALAIAFPDIQLNVDRDGSTFKIYGDLSLQDA